MLKGLKKHEDKEQGKTKHEASRSINHKATQNKNNTGTTALERCLDSALQTSILCCLNKEKFYGKCIATHTVCLKPVFIVS